MSSTTSRGRAIACEGTSQALKKCQCRSGMNCRRKLPAHSGETPFSNLKIMECQCLQPEFGDLAVFGSPFGPVYHHPDATLPPTNVVPSSRSAFRWYKNSVWSVQFGYNSHHRETMYRRPGLPVLRGSIRSSYCPSSSSASTKKVTRLARGVMLPEAMCHLFGLHNN